MVLERTDRRRFIKYVSISTSVGLVGCAAPTVDDRESTPTGEDDSGSGGTRHTVGMYTRGSDYYFDPIGLHVEPGDTVEFVNESGAHSATAYHPDNDDHDLRIPDGAEPWDSGILSQEDEMFEYTFEVEGTYDYYCIPHEQLGMIARIVCGEPGGPGENDTPPFNPSSGDFPDSQTIVEQSTVGFPFGVEGGDTGVENGDQGDVELPVHDVLMTENDLPQTKQHNVEDLRDLLIVIERDNESIALVDTTTHERIGRVNDVGNAIHVVDFHSKLPENTREGAYVYTQSREGWMYKVDLFGFNRVARLRAGTDARDIAVSRDNKYVAGGFYTPRQLTIADASDMSHIKTMEVKGENADGEVVPSQVHALYDVPEQGMYLMALFEAGRIQFVDYTRDDFPIVADIPVASRLHDGFFSADGRYFFIASQGDDLIGVIDTQRQELAATIETADVPHPGPGAVDPEHNQAFTTHLGAPKVSVWDTKEFKLKKIIDVPGKGLFIRKHPNSKYVWADVLFDSEETDSLVYQIDPETLEVVNTVDTKQWGDGRSLHPEFTRDGSQVYISLWDAGKLVVLDSETGDYVSQIDGFTTPTGKFLGARAEGHSFTAGIEDGTHNS